MAVSGSDQLERRTGGDGVSTRTTRAYHPWRYSREAHAPLNQYDAFAGYCEAAEAEGIDQYPLYQWTKDTIDDPVKKAKYLTAFTLYVDGDEVYDGEKAHPLEADLQPLAENGLLDKLSKHDTNPANNPQPPKKYRQS